MGGAPDRPQLCLLLVSSQMTQASSVPSRMPSSINGEAGAHYISASRLPLLAGT